MKPAASLRRRFFFSFAGLLAGLSLLAVVLTMGTLFAYYRSTIEDRTQEASRRFETAMQEMQEALLFRGRILADISRIEGMGHGSRVVREIQVHTLRWLKSDGLQVLGAGTQDYWLQRPAMAPLTQSAFLGVPTVDLLVREEGAPVLVAATPQEGPGGVKEVMLTGIPLDADTLENLAHRIGAEILVLNASAAVWTTSRKPSANPSPATLAGTRQGARTLEWEGATYAVRTFPLRIGQRLVGQYAVAWPARDLQEYTRKLAIWPLGGVFLGLLLYAYLYRRFVATSAADILALTDWARAFRRDEPVAPPDLRRVEEVRVLSKVVSELVADLESALHEVEVKNLALGAANATLEENVRQKTSELEDQRRLLDSVLTGMRQAVFLCERGGEVRYANPAAREAFGPVDGPQLWSLAGVPAHGDLAAPQEAEAEWGERTYLVTSAPLEGTGQILVVAQDITLRRTLEQQLLQSQKLESVGRLAGGVAHDFNNVLGSIVPCIDILRRRITDERSVTYLETIESAAGRAADVVRQLLTFSRTGEFRPQALGLNNAVEGALKLLRPGLKKVRLVWSPGNDLPVVRADETQVQQVVLNLALNAVDAMNGDGILSIATRASDDRNHAILSVSDTGPGIPPEQVGKVFDPFFTTKQPGKGTGLGLSIVYGVVERHGGSIQVMKGDETGARFEVAFPVTVKGDHAPEEPRENGTRPTLLLVDDDRLLLESLRDALRDYGFRAVAARSSEEAMQLAGRVDLHVDVAVIDVRLPDGGGPALAERLQRQRPGLPVLFMTGVLQEEGDLSRLSPYPPLPKPFPPAKLVELLHGALRQSKV